MPAERRKWKGSELSWIKLETKAIEKISETKCCVFDKIKKKNLKNLQHWPRNKREKLQITIITTEPTDGKRIIRKYYEKSSTHVFDNWDKMNLFFKRQKQTLKKKMEDLKESYTYQMHQIYSKIK